MADSKVPGLLDKLPTPPTRTDAKPTLDARPKALANATAVKQILNVGGKRSPANGGE